MSRWLSWLTAMALVLGMCATAHAADDGGVQAVPALSARVIDQTGTLNEAQRQALEGKLAGVESRLGTQMVLLMVPSTQPEDISAYAQRVADTWKIGRREVGDGLLLVVAKNDRRVRIEVAKTLEGAIPDLAAKQVIDRAITPAFKAGDFAGGLNQAIDQLAARVQGEHLPLPTEAQAQRPATERHGFQWDDLGVFLFVGVPVVGARWFHTTRRMVGATNATGLEWGARPALMARTVDTACRAGVLRHARPSQESLREAGNWADRRKVRPYNLFYGDLEADAERR
ncbi:MAG: hypothetical protein EOP38_16140, partial [Rubrivivax sp.]